VVKNLVLVEEELRGTRADLKVVGRDNLHFTVKFLGEVPDDTVKEVERRLEGLALSSFDVRVRGVGAFPDLRRPRVVWAGISSESEGAMSEAAAAFTGALEGVGKPEDHEFHPHITLARVRSPLNGGALVSFLQLNAARDLGETRITSLKLKSSLLSPSGPSYTDVREYGLR
jgi:RNA 2',3'-cyclic 3'-phosphodiesterase